VIPENAKAKPTRGEVLSVGPGTWVSGDGVVPTRIPLDAKVGDVVIYDKFSGVEYTREDGSKLVILRAVEILAFERDVPEHATLTAAANAGGMGAGGGSVRLS
jgi:chaperonin GroES